MSTTDTEASVRRDMAKWIRNRIDGENVVHLPDLAKEAGEHFGSDNGFVNRFFRQQFGTIFYEMVQSTVARTRSMHLMLGDDIVSQDEIRDRSMRLSAKWSNWLEHVGDRHIRLLSMSADHLYMAAQERRERAAIDIQRAELLEALAKQLEPGETVGDRFSDDDIERIWQHVLSQHS